jgi:hypothetical protein
MKTLLTDKYDLMAGTVDKITKVLFDERHGDSETVAQVLAIIAEHEIQADQIERAWGR